MKMENAPRVVLELQQQQRTKKISLLLSYKTQTLVMINWRANIRICISKKNTEKMFASIVDGSMRDSIEHILRIGEEGRRNNKINF